MPLVVRWSGQVQAGQVSEHVCAFQDVLPTLLESVGARKAIPKSTDGISFATTLLDSGAQEEHPHLYMEFPSYGGQQMVRLGDWKAVRQNLMEDPEAPIELYNLKNDVAEKLDVSAQHPEVVKRMQEIMIHSRKPSGEFPFAALDKPPA